MSNTRYLEIDSTYRNRNDWPLPANFEVPISQTGRKNIDNAVDPVSLSVPLEVWTSNNLNLKNHSSSITGTIQIGPGSSVPVARTSDTKTFIIKSDNLTSFQKEYNYYKNLVIVLTSGFSAGIEGRIKEYIYLYNDGTNDIAQISLNSYSPDVISNNSTFIISDPTDISDKSNPYFFVPFGRIQRDSYISFILYNERLNEYRKIINYNDITNMIYLYTKSYVNSTINSGPITYWAVNDNYSIRKQPPYIASKNTITVSADSTNSTIIISGLDITDNNFYKNYCLRILPISGNKYNYSYDSGDNLETNLVPPINESSNIIKSIYDNITNLTTLFISPPFSIKPDTNSLIEIMSFSFDNLYPFVYTGSLVSQQEMVCYEIQLLDLVLPNYILKVGEGGRIAFYPYVYVQLSNVSASGAGLKNVIYSNNPNATSVTFRAPIYDVQNPLISTFVKVDGNGMTQTIKFKPNDNLFFSVTLPNGEIYQTEITDTKTPSAPNPLIQISAMFSIRRL